MMTEIISELNAENERLKTELIFTNSCLNVLLKFKNKLIDILDQRSTLSVVFLRKDEIRIFQDINREYNSLKENHFKIKEIDIKIDNSSDQLTNIKENCLEEVSSSVDNPVPNIRLKTEDTNESTLKKHETKLSSVVLTNNPKTQTIVLPKILSDENQLKQMLSNVFKINVNNIKKVVTHPITHRMPETSVAINSKSMAQNVSVSKGMTQLVTNGTNNKPVTCDLNNRKYIIMKVEKKGSESTQSDTGFKYCAVPTVQKYSYPKQYKCPINECFYETNLKKQLERHLNRCHKNIVRFKCNICEKGFVTKVTLRNHMEHHNERTIECTFPGCHKRFKTKGAIYTHRLSHSNDYPFKCNVNGCDYKAKVKSALQCHLNGFHSDERPFACDLNGCQSKFKSKHGLNEHKKTHLKNPVKNFICHFQGCEKRFPNPFSLKKHVDNHSNQKLNCDWPQCQYTTNTLQKLRNHRKNHSTERNFICDWPQCEKAFKKKQYLILHQRIHTNEKPCHCQWPGCDYKCRSSSNLATHHRIHKKNLKNLK